MSQHRVFLSRRNLLTLLSKLDRMKAGEESACTLIKYDNQNPKYPQTLDEIAITAVEDAEYYGDRSPGTVLGADDPGNKKA